MGGRAVTYDPEPKWKTAKRIKVQRNYMTAQQKIDKTMRACMKYLPDEEHDNLLEVMMLGAKGAQRLGIIIGGVIGSIITGVVTLILT